MMPNHTPLLSSDASFLKAGLVDVGFDALSRGDWLTVMAVTTLIRKRGMTHA